MEPKGAEYYLPTARFHRNEDLFRSIVAKLDGLLLVWMENDFQKAQAAASELGNAIPGVSGRINLTNYSHEAWLTINLIHHEAFALSLPRSAKGAERMRKAIAGTVQKIADGKMPIKSWAPDGVESPIREGLAALLHHIDAQADGEPPLIADRFALYRLAQHERKSTPRSLREATGRASRTLSELRAPYSRTELGRIGLQRRLNFLCISSERDDEPIDCDRINLGSNLPAAVQHDLMRRKKRPLRDVVDIALPGLRATGGALAPTGEVMVHTDAWDVKNLHVLELPNAA